MAATQHWFRWHHGTVTDPKWRVVASRCVTSVTVGHVIAVWAAMMENASQASPRGELSGWDDEDVAACLGFSIEQVSAIREAMQGKTLAGSTLTGWGKRQVNREDSAAERTKAWRERNRIERDAKAAPVTHCDAPVTHGDDRGEERREEKKEQKKEQAPRGSRLPTDWSPTAADLAWAKAERPDIDARSETENFRDHWLAKPGREAVKLDWSRTWKKWIRSAYTRGNPRHKGDGDIFAVAQ